MRLFRFQSGRFRHLPLPATSASLHAVDVETLIRQNIHADGTISSLCLDFCGSYVALQHEDEIRLAARLLCTYHNSMALPAGPGASLDESPPLGPVASECMSVSVGGMGGTGPDDGCHWKTQVSRFGGRRGFCSSSHNSQISQLTKLGQLSSQLSKLSKPSSNIHNTNHTANTDNTDKTNSSLEALQQRLKQLAAAGPDDAGESDSEDEKENKRRLAWDFELNADIDAAPNFGKARMEHHLW